MAVDTADKRGSAAGVGLTPGVTVPLPDGSIDAGDRAHLAGLYSGLAAAEPGDFVGAGFNGGTAVDANGVMGTDFLTDGTPVPAGAVFINGFAHSADGLRYVALWPASGRVYYEGKIARRGDGAMCIVLAGTPRDFHGGWGLSDRGEVIASTLTPQLVHSGFGLRQNGSLCVSEAA